MIAQLIGTISHKDVDGIIVDVQGVGYDVMVSLNTFYQLPEKGQKIILFIHTHVSENALALYGFLDPTEKRLFKKLISVSGIGPRLGLGILSGLPPQELIQAIVSENKSKLTGITGVGKKTAERLVIELKDTLIKGFEKLAAGTSFVAAVSPMGKTYDEALSALMNLGYHKTLAEETLSKITIQDGANLEKVIKDSLSILAT